MPTVNNIPQGVISTSRFGSTAHDVEVQRQELLMELLRQQVGEATAKAKEAGTKATLSDPYEAAKAASQVRSFETRRNVGAPPPAPMDFTPENFAPVAAHQVTGVRSAAPSPTGPRTVKGIRKLTDGGGYTDPDAARTARQTAMDTPSVIAAGLNADSREAVAGLKDEVAKQTRAQGLQAAQTTRDEVNRLAQEIHDDPYLASNIGVMDARTPTVRAGSVDFQSRVARLKALLSLENRSKLKGQGAISDKETQMLANSATSLTGATDEAIFRKELQRIMQATSGTAGGDTGTGRGQEFDFVPGQGLVPRVAH